VPNASIAATACSPACPSICVVIETASRERRRLAPMERASVLRGGREIGLLALGYGCYSLVRNLMGDDEGAALLHADRLIRWEQRLGLFHEHTVQTLLDHPLVIRPLNTFYALAHFIVTGSVMLWLYLRRRSTVRGNRYARWRNALLVTCSLALVGYAAFPLMPPRLTPGDGVIDALAVFGAPWTYQGDSAAAISNQFAAMPSLHVGWALWCSLVLWSEAPGRASRGGRWRTTVRALAVAYSAAAIVAVVATGNHYVLDAVGGAAVLAVGCWVTRRTGRATRRIEIDIVDLRPERDGEAASEAVVAAVDRDHVAGVVAAGGAGQVHGDATEVAR